MGFTFRNDKLSWYWWQHRQSTLWTVLIAPSVFLTKGSALHDISKVNLESIVIHMTKSLKSCQRVPSLDGNAFSRATEWWLLPPKLCKSSLSAMEVERASIPVDISERYKYCQSDFLWSLHKVIQIIWSNKKLFV